MAGSRIKTAINGLDVITRMMRPTDLFGLVTFNHEVRNLHKPIPKERVHFATDKKHIENNVGGRTALFDAIASGISLLKEVLQRRKADPKRHTLRKFVFEQLIITDGMDNSSKISFEDICKLVHHPGGLPDYHLRVVVVTKDMEAEEILKLEQLCKPRHAKLLQVSDVSALKQVLKKEAQRLELMLREKDALGNVRLSKHQLRAGSQAAIMRQCSAQLGQLQLLSV